MFSRSTMAAQGRLLSPLSPISPLAAGVPSAVGTLEPETRRLVQTRRMLQQPIKNPLEATPLLEGTDAPPMSGTGLGSETTIMERLESVLASPFSPRTFVRSILSEPPQSTVQVVDAPAKTATANPQAVPKPRRKPAPQALPLNKPSRLSDESPLSPFKYPSFVEKQASLAPMSPSRLLSKVSPVPNLAAISEDDIRRQKMEKLARCLDETVPTDIVYPSFGEVSNQASSVGSFLDYYRQATAALSAQPPTPVSSVLSPSVDRTTVDDINTTQKPRRKNSLRRSRSVGDFYSVADVLEMHTPHVELESELAGMKSPAPPLGGDMHPFASPIAIAVAQKSPVFQRTHFVKKAKEVILGDDAKKMAEFRLKFSSPRPLDLSFSTLQSQSPIPSPVPSALEAVKSPRVPYWVKPKMSYPVPKTPRTMRTERRQGWGGSWELGEVVNKLKELQ